jgi:hypothetical protein
MLEANGHSNNNNSAAHSFNFRDGPESKETSIVNHLIIAPCVSSLFNHVNNTPAERRKK